MNIAVAELMKDNAGTITSSFFLSPKAFKAACNAAVPLLKQTAYFVPIYLENFFQIGLHFFH